MVAVIEQVSTKKIDGNTAHSILKAVRDADWPFKKFGILSAIHIPVTVVENFIVDLEQNAELLCKVEISANSAKVDSDGDSEYYAVLNQAKYEPKLKLNWKPVSNL